MQITIVGAGAIGGTLGAYLARAGEDVRFVDLVKEHVDAINERGLSITGIRGDFTVRVPAITPDALEAPLAQAGRDPGGSHEWVFLAVKAQHTESAVRQLLPFLTPRSAVVSLQNGLNERRIAALIGPERTIGAHINWASDYLGPGQILHGGDGSFYVGELDGSLSKRIQLLGEKFSNVAETHVTDNIWGYLWAKQCLASLNYATALVDADVADILASDANKRVGLALLAEAVRVAEADGVRLQPFDGFEPGRMRPQTHEELRCAYAMFDVMVDKLWRQLKRRTGIWRDLAVRKRTTEVDYRVAEIVQRGEELGVEVPLNSALVRMIHEIENGTRVMSDQNLREIERLVDERRLLPA